MAVFLVLADGHELPGIEKNYSYYIELFSFHEWVEPPLSKKSHAINDVLEDCLEITDDERFYSVVECDMDFENEKEFDECIEESLVIWRANTKACHESELWYRFRFVLE